MKHQRDHNKNIVQQYMIKRSISLDHMYNYLNGHFNANNKIKNSLENSLLFTVK